MLHPDNAGDAVIACCDVCPFSPTCEEEEDQVSHSYRPHPGTPLERPEVGIWSDATQEAIDARDLSAELSHSDARDKS